MNSTELYVIVLSALAVLIIYRLRPLFSPRRIIEYYGAILTPVDDNEYVAGGKGELERVYFEDGNSELKLKLYGTDFPGRAGLKLNVNGYTIHEVKTYRGGAYIRLDSRDGSSVPYIGNGDKVELLFNETPVLAGIVKRG